MNACRVSVWTIKKIALMAFLYLFVILYISFFYEFLQSKEWINVDDYTRIIVPDTFLYLSISNNDYFLDSVNIKNSIGPSIIWSLLDGSWYVVGLMNIIFLFLISVYMEKLARLFGVDRSRVKIGVVVFLIMPASIMFSVGALKELPSALFMLIFLHGLITKKYKELFLCTRQKIDQIRKGYRFHVSSLCRDLIWGWF